MMVVDWVYYVWKFVLAATFGAAAASFINVLVYRYGWSWRDLFVKSSHCESCKKPLGTLELTPVLGWMFLRGKCKKCSAKIPMVHPLSEAVLALITGFIWIRLGNDPGEASLVTLFVFVMYYFSMFDVLNGIVPDKILYPIIAITLALGGLFVPMNRWGDHLLAGGLYFVFFAGINFLAGVGMMPGLDVVKSKKKGAKVKKQSFGWGDAKYGIWLGLIFGVAQTVVALWASVFSGALLGGILLLNRGLHGKNTRGMTMPFVPFMSLGAVAAVVWGESIVLLVRSFLYI